MAYMSELEIIKLYMDRVNNSKTQKQLYENKLDLRLFSLKALAKRYQLKEIITNEIIEEAINIMAQPNCKYGQKKAARELINIKFGVSEANKIIKKIAIVDDREDTLVKEWRKEIIKRDKCCQNCGSKSNLHAHHISHWSDDPVNRINIDNGITLCSKCHAKEHLELTALITSRQKEVLHE